MERNYSTSLLLTKIFRLTDPCAFGCCQIRDKLEKPIFFVTILELTCFNTGVSPETDGRDVAGIPTWPIHWAGQTSRNPRAYFFRTFCKHETAFERPRWSRKCENKHSLFIRFCYSLRQSKTL